LLTLLFPRIVAASHSGIPLPGLLLCGLQGVLLGKNPAVARRAAALALHDEGFGVPGEPDTKAGLLCIAQRPLAHILGCRLSQKNALLFIEHDDLAVHELRALSEGEFLDQFGSEQDAHRHGSCLPRRRHPTTSMATVWLPTEPHFAHIEPGHRTGKIG